MTATHYRELPPWQQLLYLFLLWIGCMILGAVISIAVVAGMYGTGMAWQILQMNGPATPEYISAFRIFLGLGNTAIPFLLPAFIFSYWIMQEPEEYIGIRNYFSWLLLLLAFGFMLFFQPLVEITGYFNQKMTLPPAMHGLDQWIHDTEKQSEDVIKVILNMKTTADLMISLLVIAILPAISEEFFFRGCMQPIFDRWTKNTHAAVWITAFIFSFIHFEFLGFIPRFLLGAGLGYLYAWSGSIWPSVVAHCLNNALAVLGYYVSQHKLLAFDPDSNAPMFSHTWIYVLCTATAIFMLLIYRMVTLSHTDPYHHHDVTDGEELD